MDMTTSYPISTNVTGRKAAYVDPATGVAAVPNVAAAKCTGLFIQDTVATEGFAPVQKEGPSSAIFGAAANYQDSLTVDAQGRLVPASGSAGTKVWCVAISESKVAQADDIGDVFIHPHMVVM